jgi:hypothetical protein
MRFTLAALVLLTATAAGAQSFAVGSFPTNPASTLSINNSVAPVSFVNYTNRAQTAGTVSRASVLWSKACAGAFKVVFLRPGTSPTVFTVVAQRGPFDAVAGRNEVALVPPVALNENDVLAVVQMQSFSACGTVAVAGVPFGESATFLAASDVSSGNPPVGAAFYPAGIPAAVAYGPDPLVVRVVPVAGALQGATAFFRTALQMSNVTNNPITGKLVFHPAAKAAAPGDPTLAFTIREAQTIAFPDVITSMGTSGLGSLDILTDSGATPLVTARVFSDGGAAGTTGLATEALAPATALDDLQTGYLLTPPDLVNFRMNIGIRTLDAGATVLIALYDANGSNKGFRTQTLPANYFVQGLATDFTNTTALPANGRIAVTVSAGSAFVYSTIVDNRTSDSTLTYARSR